MARIDIEDRKLALAQLLGVEVTEIKEGYSDTTFECESEQGEWLVLTDDEADEQAKQSCIDLLDDIGIEGMNDPEYIIERFSNYDWESDMHESNLAYALDIQSDSVRGYANRLVKEAIDRKIIKEKDCFENEDGDLDYDDLDQLAEDLADDMDKDYDSMADFFESIYGRGWTSEVDFLKDYIDFNGVADYIIDNGGREMQLASYDFEENKEKVGKEWFYIYRIN
jgi:hypothetical protein